MQFEIDILNKIHHLHHHCIIINDIMQILFAFNILNVVEGQSYVIISQYKHNLLKGSTLSIISFLT